MSKTRRERCLNCGFLDVIKWGRRDLFTFRRKDVSKANRFVWFEWWILRKQTVPQIAELSGCSERQLYRWFDEYLENLKSVGIEIESDVLHLLTVMIKICNFLKVYFSL
ncbi:MAG: helix-turn-helix domain-containing protein [Bacteroidales bacterium]|nr:helix-turn-helix domain-containing protein [Bacteroidales bacterium]